MENSKHYKSGFPSAREVAIKWDSREAGVPFTSRFGVHCGLWREMMTTRGVLLALCDAMLGSGVIWACGFLCFAFPIRISQRVGSAGKRPPVCSISTLSGPCGSEYNAQDKAQGTGTAGTVVQGG